MDFFRRNDKLVQQVPQLKLIKGGLAESFEAPRRAGFADVVRNFVYIDMVGGERVHWHKVDDRPALRQQLASIAIDNGV